MSVKIKKAEQGKGSDKVIHFRKQDFVAIEGTEKSFFNGKVKAVHQVQADKLIASGKAKLAKNVELDEKVDTNRTVKDLTPNK